MEVIICVISFCLDARLLLWYFEPCWLLRVLLKEALPVLRHVEGVWRLGLDHLQATLQVEHNITCKSLREFCSKSCRR